MKKYEEERYRWKNIREDIYPWIKESLVDHQALNGKYISDKDTPLISFVGDLMIVFVIRREGGTYEILKDNMLPPESDMEQIYHIACENLVRDVEFVISHTWYGGFGIVADGIHEASSLCFKHIWNVCAEKLGDDIAIMAPSKDMVLFVPAKDETLVEKMRAFGEEAFARSRDKISRDVFIYTKDGKELLLYGKSGY